MADTRGFGLIAISLRMAPPRDPARSVTVEELTRILPAVQASVRVVGGRPPDATTSLATVASGAFRSLE